jgi:sucrose phosphorylase
MLKNKVQLITYPDSLGSNLNELHYVLKKYFGQSVGGVHILPFYPSSADRGFCPLTYAEVDAKFGDWDDIEKIGQDFDLVVDFIPNHISRMSPFFLDYMEKGKDSQYYDLFLQVQKVYPGGTIPKDELTKIYLRKQSSPEMLIEFPSGYKEYIWQTFESDQQIDLDVQSEVYRQLYGNFMIKLARRGVKLFRMDAIGYVIKKAGTSCFMVEPDVWHFVDWAKDKVAVFGAQILPEMHAYHTDQINMAQKVDYVYDFCLPFLTLHSLWNKDCSKLKQWLDICPHNQVTTLDTHDGIPVEDCRHLLSESESQLTVDKLLSLGANINYNYQGDGSKVIYQLDITYFSALKENENAYLLARSLQMFTPGIPQVYYVGALAGKNDYASLAKFTGIKEGAWGRDVNRHNYTLAEIDREVQKPIVQKLLKLMEFRSTHPAFDGQIEVNQEASDKLTIEWKNDIYWAKLKADFNTYSLTIEFNDENNTAKNLF